MIEVIPDYSAYTGSRTGNSSSQPPKKQILRNVIVAAVAIILAAVAMVLLLRQVQHSQQVDAVKNTLISQNKIMQASVKDGVYSATAPVQVASTKEVQISSTVSSDGKSYCISGKSLKDEKIVFNIGTHTPADAPKEGGCDAKGNAIVPTKPPLPSVGSMTAESVNLTWDQSAFATSYNLRCSMDKNYMSDVAKGDSNANNGTVKGLKGSATYFCSVQAVNETGVSLWSDSVTVQTTIISTAPADLKITPVSKSEIQYSWSAVAGATSYELEYSSDPNFVKDVVKVTVTNVSGSMTGLKADTLYYVHVRAFTEQFNVSNAAFSGVVEEKTLK